MSEAINPSVQMESKPMDDVAGKGENLLTFTKSSATDLRDVGVAIDGIQNEGVLSDDEKDNAKPYSDEELRAMGVEDKQAFLAELQAVAKEKGPKFVMELQRNLKEGKLSWVDFQRQATESQLQNKIESASKKKELIEANRDAKLDKTRAKYTKDDEKALRKAKNKIRKLAAKLKKNSTVKEFSHDVHGVLENYFHLQRTEEVSHAISTKRDEISNDPKVAALISQIQAESSQLKQDRDSRKQGLLAELAAIDSATKHELRQLRDSSSAEVAALKARLSELEQQKYDLEDELVNLEEQMEDRDRLQSSIDALKDELRKFSFTDATKILSDMEGRAANTLSMESLSVDKENLADRLSSVPEIAAKLEDELKIAMSQVESAIETSYAGALNDLQSEKGSLLGEKEGAHKELVKVLNEPFAAAIEKIREGTDLREGSNAIEIVSMFSGLGGQAVKAEKRIGKSAAALEKFKTGLEKRFVKLTAKLDNSKDQAQVEADSRFDSIGEVIANAQKLAEEAKQNDFSGVQETWFNRVWKKLVG